MIIYFLAVLIGLILGWIISRVTRRDSAAVKPTPVIDVALQEERKRLNMALAGIGAAVLLMLLVRRLTMKGDDNAEFPPDSIE